MTNLKVSILLADSPLDGSSELESILGELPLRIIRASSRQEAGEKAIDDFFAIVLLNFSSASTGLEVARDLRCLPQTSVTPIVFVASTYPSEESMEQAYKLGAVDFIFGPISAAAIKAKISLLISLQRCTADAAPLPFFYRRHAQAQGVRAAPREIEPELRCSEERYHSLFREMAEGFCLIELLYDDVGLPVNYKFLETNAAFELHSDLRGATGKTILDMVPDFEPEWFQAYHQVAVTGEALKFESEFKSMKRWFDVSVTRADGAGRLSIVFSDITVRKDAEEKLKESEEHFKSLFESIDEGFCVVDVVFDSEGNARDYIFLQTNAAFSWQTGLSPAQGATARQVIPNLEEYWLSSVGDAVRTGQPRRFASEANALGRAFDIYVNRIGGSGSTKAALVFRDITEIKRTERALRNKAALLSEADRQKNEFLAALAHELRSPLAPLINGLHLLEQSTSQPKARAIIDMMKRQLDNMVNLVNDLLDIARISSGKIELKKERSDLRTVIASAIETCMPLIDSKNHTLLVNIPTEPTWLNIDPMRIIQAISNLLNNAAKYTPAGGIIEISAWQDAASNRVSITDTGVGIEKDAMSGIFDLFTQVRQSGDLAMGGLGIGLSLVRKMVELHGGMATAQSSGPGKGSTFSITLPRDQDISDSAMTSQVEAVTSQMENVAATIAPLRILIVDNNNDAAESLAAILKISGHTIKLAGDGVEALDIAASFTPEVVFLEIRLPDLDGYEVARAMRKLACTEQSTLIALTGWSAESDRSKARAVGFDHHLTKPAQLEIIEGIMRCVTHDPRRYLVR